MLRKVWSWFHHIYVDDVLAEFNAIVAKLGKVSVFHDKQVKLHDEEAAFHAAAAAASENESERAKTVLTNIKVLLSA